MDIVVTKKNNNYAHVACDPSIAFEISDHFTFMVPGAKFTPMYRARQWDGKIRLFSLLTRELPFGLIDHLQEFAKTNGYSIEVKIHDVYEKVTIEEVKEFCDSLNLHSGGKPIQCRDYQLDAIHRGITKGRNMLISPTASGKSLIIYCLIRWFEMRNKKQLIVVPTTALVEQMRSDFLDYSTENGWKPSIAVIYSGHEKENKANVIISTWQSIFKLPKEFFIPFECVYGDEAHLFKAKSLGTVMNNCVNADYRQGTTGTLDGTKTHQLVLEGMFGPVYRVTRTKDLMERNEIATLKIWCIKLAYDDEIRKSCKNLTYQEEMDFLVTHEKRNKFIRNLAINTKGNTLVLFQYVEKHGKIMYDMIKAKVPINRKVFFIYGAVEAKERELVRKIVETETDALIIASYGTMSTGTNIRNLDNIIFASPSKSKIRNLQSIGRCLRISDSKTKGFLYDISDDLTWKSKTNYTFEHMKERLKIYFEEQFDYAIYEVKI